MKKYPTKSPSKRDKHKHSNDYLITPAERVIHLFVPGSILILLVLMGWLDGGMSLPDLWPEVLVARHWDVAVELGGGLEGPPWEEDLLHWPWLVPLC